MAKKTFFNRVSLKKSGQIWSFDLLISYPQNGTFRRLRRDFNINSLPDEATKKIVAEFLLKNFAEFFVLGEADTPPMAATSAEAKPISPTVLTVVGDMCALKIAMSGKKNTERSYNSSLKNFEAYLKASNLEQIPISDFSKKMALGYQDFLRGKKCANASVNNRTREAYGFFECAKDRGLIEFNPFAGLKNLKKAKKKRRPFTDEERRTVADAVKETDIWLYRGLLLQFYCGIRPVELTRLKFGDFDFSTGLVCVKDEAAKSGRTSFRTLPKHIIPVFLDGVFEKYPTNWYVFGQKNRPSKSTDEKTHTAYNAHKRILERLHDEGKLPDIDGLQWYSWKDTHALVQSKHVRPFSLKDQFNHADLTTTMIYYQAPKINEEYRDLPDTLHN
jgi:integrase